MIASNYSRRRQRQASSSSSSSLLLSKAMTLITASMIICISAVNASSSFTQQLLHDENNKNNNSTSTHDQLQPFPQNRPNAMTRTSLPPPLHSPLPPHRLINYPPTHPHASPSTRRHLLSSNSTSASDLFQPLRIHLETTELLSWAATHQNPRIKSKIRYIVDTILPTTANLWSSALSVVPVAGPLVGHHDWCPFADPDDPIFDRGTIADVIVYVTVDSAVCAGGGVLASAVSCHWDQYQRPIGGNIDFCLGMVDDGEGSDDEPESVTETKTLMTVGTAVHEFGHILGINSDDFLFYYDWKTGLPRTRSPKEEEVECVTGATKTLFVPGEDTLKKRVGGKGGVYYELVTPTVRQVARNQFDCQTLTGVRMENQPTADDCFGSHFDERLYFTENMSPVLGNVPEVLSSLTLALLQDTGWYQPNYGHAGVSPFGHGAGCDFVEKECVVRGVVPSYSKGFFCNEKIEYENGLFSGVYGCDPTHTHMAMCDLVDYGVLKQYEPPEKRFQHFDDENLGALLDSSDYCPTYSLESISCHDFNKNPQNTKVPSFASTQSIPESYGPDARCYVTDGPRPVCLHTICNEVNHTVVVRVGASSFECEEEGMWFELPGGEGARFECPSIATICPDLICPANCAGHGICDYSQKDPVCRCFDEDDTSPGCTNSGFNVPPQRPWDDSAAPATAAFGNGSMSRALLMGGLLFVLSLMSTAL